MKSLGYPTCYIWRTNLPNLFPTKPKQAHCISFIFVSPETRIMKSYLSLPLGYLHIVVASISIMNYEFLADLSIPGRLTHDEKQTLQVAQLQHQQGIVSILLTSCEKASREILSLLISATFQLVPPTENSWHDWKIGAKQRGMADSYLTQKKGEKFWFQQMLSYLISQACNRIPKISRGGAKRSSTFSVVEIKFRDVYIF